MKPISPISGIVPSVFTKNSARYKNITFFQYLRDSRRNFSPVINNHKFKTLKNFSTLLTRGKTLPDEIINVPRPNFAYRRSHPPIYSRIDLASLPEPSGPLNKGIAQVIMDWAGTLVDCGVYSPQVVYFKLFQKYGVPITMDEARAPMGKHKFHHLKDIFELRIEPNMPPVKERWREKYGSYPDEESLKIMFADFPAMQMACLEEYSVPITGAAETLHNISEMGWKTAVTTGFLSGMNIFLTQLVDKIGKIDFPCSAAEVPYGRPLPEMPLLAMAKANVAPSYAVKVGDTQGDSQEGLKANTWVIAVTDTSTYVNKNEKELNELAIKKSEEFEKLRESAFYKQAQIQPHYIIDGIWNLFPVLRQIDLLCKSGYHPYHFPVKETHDPKTLYRPAKIASCS